MLKRACKVKVLCQAVGEVGCASKQFFGTAYCFFQRDHGLKGALLIWPVKFLFVCALSYHYVCLSVSYDLFMSGL